MSRDYNFRNSTMRVVKSLPSSAIVTDRKLLSPAAAYEKWAGRGTTPKKPAESKPFQNDVGKVRRPKLELKRQSSSEREWEGSSPTPSVPFLSKSQLWPDGMPEIPQRPERLEGNEPPQVRAPPPSPRLRNLNFNKKIFSQLFDVAVATTKRRQQDSNVTFDDVLKQRC